MDLRKELRIMVKYILPPEDREEDVIENYVDTLVFINEKYVEHLLFKDNTLDNPKHMEEVLCFFDETCRVGYWNEEIKRWVIHSDGLKRYRKFISKCLSIPKE